MTTRGAAAVAGLVLLASRLALAADPCATPVGSVSGTVVRAGDDTPVAGARVRVQGCLGGAATTDATGAFTLPVPAGTMVVAAVADGHFVGCWRSTAGECTPVGAGATDLRIRLEAITASDDPAYTFRDPSTCAPCHQDIVDQWSRSTKATTNQNRWVLDLYNGTDATMPPGPPPDPQNPPYFAFLARHNVDARHPTRFGECANCHQPEYVGTNPTNTDFNAFAGTDRHGVGCDFCHKMVDVDTSAEGLPRPNLVPPHDGLGPAKTTMLRATTQPWLVFGPHEDVTFAKEPDMRAGHASILRSSRLCAACHEDSTDPRDQHGDFIGTYTGPASQLTYSEWLASPYAAEGVQCQDCHMPPVGTDTMCSVPGVPRRDPSQIRSHTFEGTTPAFLRRSAKLRTFTTITDDTLSVRVDVTNVGAGHSLPTGVTLRNLILVVQATDRNGTPLEHLDDRVIPNWGGAGPRDQGNFAGLPGKGYARVLVDESLVENVLFTVAVAAFDNRIPARATDTTTYTFALPRDWRKRDVRVDTRLYYRRAFKPTASQRKWNVPLAGNAHGTRGDGGDYDENFVMAATRNFLTCKGKLAKLRATVPVGSTTAEVSATLAIPKGVTFDPRQHGVGVMLGHPDRPAAALQERLEGFTVNGRTVSLTDTTGPIAGLSFTRASARSVRMALRLPAQSLASGLALGIDSGDVCFRRPLRCKTKRGALVCR